MVAWPPQVTMLTFGGVEVLVEVDRGHARTGRSRPASGRSGACRAARSAAALATWALARGGVEDDVDVVEVGHARSGRRRRRAVVGTPSRAARARPSECGVDADHRAHLEVLGDGAGP